MVAIHTDIYAFGHNENMKAEVYKNGQWTYIQDMPGKVAFLCAVKLDDNTIMSIGGKEGPNVIIFPNHLSLMNFNIKYNFMKLDNSSFDSLL